MKTRNKNKILKSFRLSPDLVRAIEKMARETGLDQTGVVERLLSDALKVNQPAGNLPRVRAAKETLIPAA